MDLSATRLGEESPQRPSTSTTDEIDGRSGKRDFSRKPVNGGGQGPKENSKESPKDADNPTKLLLNMEALITKFLTTSQPTVGNINNIQFIQFNPDDNDADVENWCKLTEMIVHNKKLEGVELLVPLTNALKGRAASCLTKLNVSQISWERVKEVLLAKFSKPKLIQDYFDDVLNFTIGDEETACQAGLRLWDLIEAIPNVQMSEEVMTGFAVSVLCKDRKFMQLSLRSTAITSRAQFLNVLRGISMKHMPNQEYQPPLKKRVVVKKVLGKCASCHVEEYRNVQHKKQKIPSNQQSVIKFEGSHGDSSINKRNEKVEVQGKPIM